MMLGRLHIAITVLARTARHAHRDRIAKPLEACGVVERIAARPRQRGDTGVERSRQAGAPVAVPIARSEEHTSELQSLMRISYAVFCLKQKNIKITTNMISYED